MALAETVKRQSKTKHGFDWHNRWAGIYTYGREDSRKASPAKVFDEPLM